MKKYNENEIRNILPSLEGWDCISNYLQKKFVFKDFIEATSFIVRVSIISEKLNHHAEIKNLYNKVTLKVNTHSEGNVITDLDIRFAREVEKLLA